MVKTNGTSPRNTKKKIYPIDETLGETRLTTNAFTLFIFDAIKIVAHSLMIDVRVRGFRILIDQYLRIC